jgi:hypothetical protein
LKSMQEEQNEMLRVIAAATELRQLGHLKR